MHTLTVEVPDEALARIREEAGRLQVPPELLAREWLMLLAHAVRTDVDSASGSALSPEERRERFDRYRARLDREFEDLYRRLANA